MAIQKVVISQVQIQEDELVDFLLKKIKDVFRVRNSDITLNKETTENEETIYNIEFNEPIITLSDKFDEFTNFIMRLGFLLMDWKVETLEYTDKYKHWNSIEEYMNDDRMRIIIVFEKEDKKGKRIVHIKKIIIGNISLIKHPISEKVEELMRILDRYEIEYYHRARPASESIEIKGYIKQVYGNNGFTFYCHEGDKGIGVWEWEKDRPKRIEVFNLLKSESEFVELPKDSRIDFEDGHLYLRFFHE